MDQFYKFYQKSPEERIELLLHNTNLSSESAQTLKEQRQLPQEIANQMIENQITIHGIPMGLVPDILINGQYYLVPMATEEPSVIAAASNAAKIISKAGGFHTTQEERFMIGEIAISHATRSLAELTEEIAHKQDKFLAIANQAHPSIVKRGGGARHIWLEEKTTPDASESFLICYLTVDTQEAMGANILNTMLEALRTPLETWTGGSVLMAILSNLASNCLVQATCQIPVANLTHRSIEGIVVAEKMAQASRLAQADIYRAATHNKGIMNGIDAVILATGNDWRAIEAGAHAYAALNGSYQPLATWKVQEEVLIGSIQLPLPVGTVGGSIAIHPTATLAHNLLGNPNARELASIVASIGLAQNFAALRALVTDGIQKGHMKLQAKSLAIAVGANSEEVSQLVTLLQRAKHLNQETARQLLASLRES